MLSEELGLRVRAYACMHAYICTRVWMSMCRTDGWPPGGVRESKASITLARLTSK